MIVVEKSEKAGKRRTLDDWKMTAGLFGEGHASWRLAANKRLASTIGKEQGYARRARGSPCTIKQVPPAQAVRPQAHYRLTRALRADSRYDQLMHWTDEGVILSVRPHGETAAVAEIFTRSHGRHLGLVHGGRSGRLRPVLQTGNHVEAVWRARLAEHLGQVRVELRRGYAAQVMEDALALAGLSSMCALARLLPERDPHPSLFEVTLFVLGFLDEGTVWPALMVRWELALLDELGFGLDLSSCAATGTKQDLTYVSPKSGRAVSAAAGEPYKDKLLRLPTFLIKSRQGTIMRQDVVAGLTLTGHFLEARVLNSRGEEMLEARVRFKDLLERSIKAN